MGGGYSHRLIITSVQPKHSSHGIVDYKFFCFGGLTEFVYVMGDREVGDKVKVRLVSRTFERLPVLRVGDDDIGEIEKPQNYDKMLDIAEKLGKDFPHVRVDLYNVKGNVYFGELTCYNASGYMNFDPDKFDYEIGEKFNLGGFRN